MQKSAENFKTVGFVLLVTAVFLNQTKALRQLTMGLQSQRAEIEQQNALLEQQSRQLAEWNQTLSQRVEEQVSHIFEAGLIPRYGDKSYTLSRPGEWAYGCSHAR